MGKLTINGPFSIAMLNYQRVSNVTRPIPRYSRVSIGDFFLCWEAGEGISRLAQFRRRWMILSKSGNRISRNLLWLVVDLALWKMMEWKSVGIVVPNLWKNKGHVPNHQPVLGSKWISRSQRISRNVLFNLSCEESFEVTTSCFTHQPTSLRPGWPFEGCPQADWEHRNDTMRCLRPRNVGTGSELLGEWYKPVIQQS